MLRLPPSSSFFFFNDTATTEIYTLSLHDALPILRKGKYDEEIERSSGPGPPFRLRPPRPRPGEDEKEGQGQSSRSEEHTSELQSPCNLVCRLLLEKKNKYNRIQSCSSKNETLRVN